jgi:hypothetical protein
MATDGYDAYLDRLDREVRANYARIKLRQWEREARDAKLDTLYKEVKAWKPWPLKSAAERARLLRSAPQGTPSRFETRNSATNRNAMRQMARIALETDHPNANYCALILGSDSIPTEFELAGARRQDAQRASARVKALENSVPTWAREMLARSERLRPTSLSSGSLRAGVYNGAIIG